MILRLILSLYRFELAIARSTGRSHADIARIRDNIRSLESTVHRNHINSVFL